MSNLPNYKTRLYAVWMTMKQRCENPNNNNYAKYGARGIKVCDEWHTFTVFKEWAYANGYDDTAPKGQCTIDRIDVNGNYEPSNCRWVDNKTQGNNRTNNRIITLDGVSHTLTEWCDVYNIPIKNVAARVHNCGWSYEKAITTPLKNVGWQYTEERRKKLQNRFLTCQGLTMSLSEWSRKTGISESTISSRISRHGWSEEKAILTPVRRYKNYE